MISPSWDALSPPHKDPLSAQCTPGRNLTGVVIKVPQALSFSSPCHQLTA
jgi:hypothetical protein